MMCCSVCSQRLQVDLERSAAINRSLGSRVAQCSLNGLADFLYRFPRTPLPVSICTVKGKNETSKHRKPIQPVRI